MKDAYYFPHDSNAKDDPKCIQLIEEQGVEGYGIFWILIETLRSQTDYKAPMSILNGLARRYNTTAEKMRNVVLKYDLFSVTDDDRFFFSESFSRRMSYIDERRKKLSQAGKKGNKIRWESPPDRLAIATQSQVKESKGNKSESVDSHTHILLPDVQEYFISKGATQKQAEKFFNHYEAIDWTLNGNQIKNWKAKANTWISDDRTKRPEEEYKVIDGGVML